ncbi:hypothetical protein D3C74_49940 [compost metagenome]
MTAASLPKPIKMDDVPENIRNLMFELIGERQRDRVTWGETPDFYRAEFINRKSTTIIVVSYNKATGEVQRFPMA